MSEDKGWSYAVTHRVPGTFPPAGLYTQDAGTIYKSMRRPEVSPRGLASAIQMCQFYINRAGKSLSEPRKREISKAIQYLQTELRYYNALGKSDFSALEGQVGRDWENLKKEVDISQEPEPYRGIGTNVYLQKIDELIAHKQSQKR